MSRATSGSVRATSVTCGNSASRYLPLPPSCGFAGSAGVDAPAIQGTPWGVGGSPRTLNQCCCYQGEPDGSQAARALPLRRMREASRARRAPVQSRSSQAAAQRPAEPGRVGVREVPQASRTAAHVRQPGRLRQAQACRRAGTQAQESRSPEAVEAAGRCGTPQAGRRATQSCGQGEESRSSQASGPSPAAGARLPDVPGPGVRPVSVPGLPGGARELPASPWSVTS